MMTPDIVVCARVDTPEAPGVDAVRSMCDDCRLDVWVMPITQAILAAFPKTPILCLECVCARLGKAT